VIDGYTDYEKVIDEKFDDILDVVGLVPGKGHIIHFPYYDL
jgi:hypothetical protein